MVVKKHVVRSIAAALAAVCVLLAFVGCAGHRHEFTDGICSVCGAACAHSYTDGVCTVCGTECDHVYIDGACGECGIACDHDYFNRVCNTCGEVKPSHYDYVAHVSDGLPRISISTVDPSDAGKLATTDDLQFDMNNLDSKNNRPYYACTLSVGNCAEEYKLNAVTAEVKIRGNYTANYPKKPFKIKFDKKQRMLGLNGDAACKSWVLLADYKDIAMTRNSLAYYLGKQILGSDDYYSTDFRPVELYLNGNYWGMYLLAEQQQVNKYRVDVPEPDDGYTGTDIGYMLEYDGYYKFEAENERFVVDYNRNGMLTKHDGSKTWARADIGFTVKNDVYEDASGKCAQTEFIKNYIQNLYDACYKAVYKHEYYAFDENHKLVRYTPKTDEPVRETVEKLIEIRSLVDVYILNEIACDADISWSSFFMSADMSADGDKLLRFEAPWDFDSAFGLKWECMDGKGLYAANSDNPWLIMFINEKWFQDEVKAKWREMREASVMSNAAEFIKSGRVRYADAYKRNFDKWGFVKNFELNDTTIALKDHAAAVEHLYDWFGTRVGYLNGLWL